MNFNKISTADKYYGTIKFSDKDFNGGRGFNEFKQGYVKPTDELFKDRDEYTLHYHEEDKTRFSCRTHALINYFIQ